MSKKTREFEIDDDTYLVLLKYYGGDIEKIDCSNK